MQLRLAANERGGPGRAVLLDQRPFVFGARARHPLGVRDLGQREQRGDDAARPAREAALRPRLVRSAVGDHDRGAVRQRAGDVGPQRCAGSSPLDTVQKRNLRSAHGKHLARLR